MVDFNSAGDQAVARPTRTPWEGAGSRSARAAFAATGIVWALLALACSTPPSPAASATEPVTLVIGVPQSRQLGLDQGLSAAANNITRDRLITTDATGRLVPRLLESWTESKDGLEWRLILRPDLLFQDGTPLGADAVKQVFENARKTKPGQSTSVCAPDITAVTVESPRQLLVRLSRRCAFLLDDIDSTVSKPGSAEGETVGAGPFVSVSGSADEVVLTQNPHFYLGAPHIDRVVMKSYDTLRTAWADMLRGRVDFLWEVSPDAAEFLKDQHSVEVRSVLSYYAYTMVMNAAKPMFKDSAVRRALNLGVDRRELVEVGLKGQGRPGDDPVWPLFWAADPATAGWAVDRAAASRLRGLSFSCLVPEGYTIYERLALLVQRQLRTLDVEMRIDAVDLPTYGRRIASSDFDAVLINLAGGPYQTIFQRFWHTPGAAGRWNTWNYSDAGVDAAIEGLRDAASESDTRAAIRDFRAAFRANPPAVVLAWSESVQAVSRRFDVPEFATSRNPLSSISRWTIRPAWTGSR